MVLIFVGIWNNRTIFEIKNRICSKLQKLLRKAQLSEWPLLSKNDCYSSDDISDFLRKSGTKGYRTGWMLWSFVKKIANIWSLTF